ncbi:uncharacterized protein LOC126844145 [Adelges cooleyi]|uniref:uncharacterized protein LOC126844145 n=1 Tax=Adelges cooleyi TaxID=133065 RepID=UPI00217FDC37|nr:uncharacterized protein LOC126844145 [Adelges cooleyi]
MFFKCSIWFLYFIIAANTVLGETEDENDLIRGSYDNCRKWLAKPQHSFITRLDFLLYMGKNISDWYALDFYFATNPAANEKRAAIDLSLYGELFKHICNKHGRSVRDCAKYRKKKAASRTYRAATMLEWEDRDSSQE